MQEKELENLLKRYREGTATEQDKVFLENWYLRHHREAAGEYGMRERAADAAQVWQMLQKETITTRKISLWPKIAVAVLVLIAIGLGTYYYFVNHTSPNNPPVFGHGEQPITNNDIDPGGNKAILTLADGRKIVLDEAANGQLAEESGIRITKAEDGQLVYEILRHAPQAHASESRIADARQPKAGSAGWRASVMRAPATYNTIQTPRGGQYKIILPDSSVVWLNAASSLRYPTRFAGAERRVELTGEAFFQVKRKELVETQHIASFIVTTATQEVTVLGTQFNINAYTDESVVKTTLLEGSVRVASTPVQSTNKPTNPPVVGHGLSTTLQPGEQSILHGNSLVKQTVDVDETIAWKNGDFIFKNEPLESIMRQIARWYDVEVVYEVKPKNLRFGGVVSRSRNLSAVLDMLRETNQVKFNVNERRITVMK